MKIENWKLIGLTTLVLVLWGFVPGLAKLSGVAGDITGFYVNASAVIAVAVIFTVTRQWHKFQKYSRRDFVMMAMLGIMWPLLSSTLYFESISRGDPAVTTMLSNSWPAFYMLVVWKLTGRHFSKMAIFAVLFALGAIAVTQLLQAKSISVSLLPIFLGLLSAVFRGAYTAATEKRWAYDPWVTTLVIEVITSIGTTMFVLIRGANLSISVNSLVYLLIIGVLANGVGFWAFAASNQLSAKLEDFWKGAWLMAMCLSPFVQVVFLALFGIPVSSYNWLGVILVSAALYLYRLGTARKA